MGKGTPFSVPEKEMILKVSETFEMEKNKLLTMVDKTGIQKSDVPIAFQNVNQRTANTLDIAECSVKRIRKAGRAWPIFGRPQKENCGRRKLELDSFEEGMVRRAVLEAFSKKVYPTIDYLHVKLQEDQCFPRMSRSTLYQICKRQLKFKFGKFEGRPVAFDRPDIAAHRAKYLRNIRKYRTEGFQIFYQDETWVNEGLSQSRGWHIPAAEQVGNDSFNPYSDPWLRGIGHRFQENLIGGLAAKPSGAGKRLVIIDVGSEDGFLGVGKQFVGKKNTADYHNEMNTEHFMEWFQLVLEALPDKSVIVLDQAKYHTAVTAETRNPTTAFRKPELIAWLEQHGIAVPHDEESFWNLKMVELRQLAKQHKIASVMQVEKMVEEENSKAGKALPQREIRLLFLPVAHCEFNPIELMWAAVKGVVRKLNTTFKLKDIEPIVKEVLNSDEINQLWAACCRHVVELEDMIMEREKIVADFVEQARERIIIEIGNDS